MISGIGGGAAQQSLQIGHQSQQSNSLKLDVKEGGGAKLDISSVPESRVRIDPVASAGAGNGLRLDISV
ncbi:MAG: hypothetical protein COB37_05505 [Kordiimonadales bacterium]|nr:MAG: hypothetical protein COB37_05505 [Kordiimonadales bacterium]